MQVVSVSNELDVWNELWNKSRAPGLDSECKWEQPSLHTYTGHGGHVQLVSLVTVTGITLCHTDTPAVLAAVQYPTILCCTQASIRLVAPWKVRRHESVVRDHAALFSAASQLCAGLLERSKAWQEGHYPDSTSSCFSHSEINYLRHSFGSKVISLIFELPLNQSWTRLNLCP